MDIRNAVVTPWQNHLSVLVSEQSTTTVRKLSDEEFETADLLEFPQTSVVQLGCEADPNTKV